MYQCRYPVGMTSFMLYNATPFPLLFSSPPFPSFQFFSSSSSSIFSLPPLLYLLPSFPPSPPHFPSPPPTSFPLLLSSTTSLFPSLPSSWLPLSTTHIGKHCNATGIAMYGSLQLDEQVCHFMDIASWFRLTPLTQIEVWTHSVIIEPG